MFPVAREAVALTLEEWASLPEEEPGEFVAGSLELRRSRELTRPCSRELTQLAA